MIKHVSILVVVLANCISAFGGVLYENIPQGAEGVTTSASVPRTGGADEAMFTGQAALITSMRFGYGIFAGGPAAFDVRVRIFDDRDFGAAAAQPQFANQVAQFTVPFTGQTPGAFLTAPIALGGAGAAVTANPVNLGVPNITDVYVQLDFFQPGTTTPVAADLVTFLFDPSGVNTGFTFASPQLGGNGTAAQEIFWRDANANGTITADELRSLGAAARSNFVLSLEGTVVPEPTALGLLAFAAAGARRSGRAEQSAGRSG